MKIKVGNAGGFCNRLFAWNTIYEIAKINNAELVCDWNELEHICLPNTTYRTNFEGYKLFNSNEIVNNNFILEDSTDYYAICGFDYTREFEAKNLLNNENTGLKKIHLKDRGLQKIIKDTCRNMVGIHVRRGDYGNGKHNNFIPKCPHSIPDSWYLNIMSQIKNINNDVTFYLSSDGTDDELKIFYDNFNIINNNTIQQDCQNNKTITLFNQLSRIPIAILNSKLLNSKLLKYITNNHFRLSNLIHRMDKEAKGITHHDAQLIHLIDLFALSECKLIICSVSSWSMVAYMLNSSPTIWPETQHQTLESLTQYRETDFQKKINISTIF